MKYYIINDKDTESYNKEFNNYTDCRNWIINHLDLSKNWSIHNGLYESPITINYNKKTIILK